MCGAQSCLAKTSVLWSNTEMNHVIELKNIGISFDNQELLKNINLVVEKGETFVLVGPSGQGKSVMIKMMSGILTPTGGQVFIEGEDLSVEGSRRRQLIKKMGMLFQKNALFDSLTCGDNIGFPLRETTELSEEEIDQRIEYFLEEVAIPHAKDLFPDEISGGMQKRLGIARALALRPEIIFYDDPTAGLDPITSRMIVQLICRLKKEYGSTVVAITNDMNRAYQMADRIGMVVDGELIVCGNVEETKGHADLRVQQFIHGYLEGPLTNEQESHLASESIASQP